MNDRPVSALRILLGAESTEDAMRAARLLPLLARGTPAVFGGVLAMGRPTAQASKGSRIVTTAGQIRSAPDAKAIETIHAHEARAFRKMLEDTAGAARAEWSAKVTSGGLGPAMAALASAWDIVVLGHRTLHRRRGAVVTLGGGVHGDSELQAVATDLASSIGVDVERIARPPSQGPGLAWFAEQLEPLNASVVVVDGAALSLGRPSDIVDLLSAARSPIVILGSARLRPRLEHTTQIMPPPEAAR